MPAFKTLNAAASSFIEKSNDQRHTTPMPLGASTSKFSRAN
jgi:hypothetical protein